MKQNLVALGIITSCLFTPSVIFATELDEIHENSPYYSGERATNRLPNGALVSDKMFSSLTEADEKQGTYKGAGITHEVIKEGVHSFNMSSLISTHVIETKNTIVLYDAGEHMQEGEELWAAIREVTDKPISAIIFSHEHYTGGTKSILAKEAERGNTNVKLIGHHRHNESINSSVMGKAIHKEASDVLLARTLHQFYTFTPKEGDYAEGHMHKIDLSMERGPVDVNTPITKDGQKMTIDGKEFTFYIEGVETDTKNQTMVHIEDDNIVMHNIVWGFYPNIYSIRGGAYRNPEGWINALSKLESLEPEIIMGTHSRSTTNRQQTVDFIESFQDSISTVLNQSLMGILRGETPAELAYSVSVPKQLQDKQVLRQDYGEVATMPPAIFAGVLGSYNGRAEDALPMHPKAEADMIIRGMGGEDKARQFAQQELDSGNFQYAVKMGKYLVDFNADSEENVAFAIEALHAMSESTESHNLRSWYLTRAQTLAGEISLPTAIPAMPAMVEANVKEFVDNYRIRLSHELAGDTRAKIGFVFESGKTHALIIRNGVSYSRDNIDDADVVIKMADVAFTKLYNNLTTVSLMVASGEAEITTGSIETAEELMSKYEVLYDWQNDKGLQFLAKML